MKISYYSVQYAKTFVFECTPELLYKLCWASLNTDNEFKNVTIFA